MEDTDGSDDPIVEGWKRALELCWQLAYGESLGRARGRRIKTFNEQGLHPFSMMVGHVIAFQEVEPVLAWAGFDPRQFQNQAEAAADRAYRQEIIDEFLETRA